MPSASIAAALAQHCWEDLFIELLGRDRFRGELVIEARGQAFTLKSIAQKRGFAVFLCRAHRTVLANRRLLRDIQKQLRKRYHEHILIQYSDTPCKQVWQWATLDGRKRISHREHPFFSNAHRRGCWRG